MSAIVIVGESDTSVVVTTSQHTRRSLFFGELLHVFSVVGGIGREAANHLLVLADSNALAFDGLDVLETRENLVIDSKDDLHLVRGAFLDREWMFAEGFNRTGMCQINGDVGSAVYFQSESFDAASARVLGVANRGAATKTKRLLVSLHSLVICIWPKSSV